MVTEPNRGSRNSRRMRSLNARWICSATRRLRGKDLATNKPQTDTRQFNGRGHGPLLHPTQRSGFKPPRQTHHLRNGTRNFHTRITLDLIADLYVVVVLHRDTAFGAGANFGDVVLEATQRFQTAFEDHHVIAQYANRVVTPHVTIRNDATRNRAEFAGAEYVTYFSQADNGFLDFRRQQAG